MLTKYVEERFPLWMLMGYYGSAENPDENLTDANDSLNLRVSPEVGQELVKRQNKLVDFIAQLADAFDKADPEKFKEFWYVSSTRF